MQKYYWSKYFDQHKKIAISPGEFKGESVENLHTSLGQASLSKAVLDLQLPMLVPFSKFHENPLLKILRALKYRSFSEVGYIGGNIITLLVKLDEFALEGKDISSTVIRGANFEYAFLSQTNFTNADLAESNFANVHHSIFSLSFSPDGILIATGNAMGEINLWQADNSKEIFTMRGHKSRVRSISFASDSHFLASGSEDCTVRLWNLKTGTCEKTLDTCDSPIRSIDFNSESCLIAGTGFDGNARIWNSETGEIFNVLAEAGTTISAVKFSPDGHTLAGGCREAKVILWNVDTGLETMLLQGISSFTSVAFNPDGQLVAGGDIDGSVMIWNSYTGELVTSWKAHSETIRAVEFSSNGNLLATGSSDRTIGIRSLQNNVSLNVLNGHTGLVSSLSFNPINHTLVSSSSQDDTLRFWNIYSGECLSVQRGYDSHASLVVFHPTEEVFVSNRKFKEIQIVDAKEYRTLKRFQGYQSVNCIVFDQTGDFLAGSTDKGIRVWNFRTGKYLKSFCKGNSVRSISFNKDAQYLASCDGSRLIRIQTIDSNHSEKILIAKGEWVTEIAFSPISEILACCSSKGIELWNAASGEYIKSIHRSSDRTQSIIFSPDGEVLFGADRENMIKLWNISTGDISSEIRGHEDQITDIALSHDGNTLASASLDGTIKLWNSKTGECLNTLKGHSYWVLSVAFSPNGLCLVSSSKDETIRLWDVKTGQCLMVLTERLYEGMNITGVKGLTEIEKSNLKDLGAFEN